jgi:NAD(P)H-dependent FMN reductase
VKVLAIAGSLRAASLNAAFCRAASRLAPAGLTVEVYGGLGSLPHFNVDLEADLPPAVVELRAKVAVAAAVLIATPEYAHGIAGVMKNGLDWLIADEPFVGKPVAVVNTSPRANRAHDALLEVLRTMSATLVHEASITVPLLGSVMTEAQIIGTPALAELTREALERLRKFLKEHYAKPHIR